MDSSDDDIPMASMAMKRFPKRPASAPASKAAAAGDGKAGGSSSVSATPAIPKKSQAPKSSPVSGSGGTPAVPGKEFKTEAERKAYKQRLKEIRKFHKGGKEKDKRKAGGGGEKRKKVKTEHQGGGRGSNGRAPGDRPPRSAAAAPKAPKVAKELDKTARISRAMKAFLWWKTKSPPDGAQWVTMEHGGVYFPPPYVPHNVPITYKGRTVELTPEQEEIATFYAAVDPEGMHLGNARTAPIFKANFFKDFKACLPKGTPIKDLDGIDFSAIRNHLDSQKLVKKAMTDNQRKEAKDAKDEINFRHGYAIVDGHLEKVGNYNMEPPGTFRGRGEHPKMGKVKQRVLPEQVALNFSEDAVPPICDVPGHSWGEVRHDPHVQWLANWKENINQQDKYMQLSASSSFKGKSDRSKYNKAARLCGNIDKIRRDYKKHLTDRDKGKRQLATAMWVIDRLALRVGGEKDTEEEADTVGCCSLRVEHMTFNPNDEPDSMEIELEFLGKDSMLFKQTIDFGSEIYNENNGMGTQVFKNFQAFCSNKSQTQDIFDTLTPTILNQHLSSLMPGLSAKVFRTYNASITLQSELAKKVNDPAWESMTVAQKVTNYNDANRIVAILCNHQRTVSKAAETQLGVIEGKVETLKEQKKVLKKILKVLQSKDKDNSVIPLKKSEEEMKASVTKSLEKAKRMKEEAKTDAEKIEATKADEKAKKMRKEAGDSKFSQAHLWEKIPNESQVGARIVLWSSKIEKMSTDLKNKEDNKEVSLSTSKINYMDPRVSVAFCKDNDVPIERVFSKTLRDKFNWSMSVPPKWQFSYEIGLED